MFLAGSIAPIPWEFVLVPVGASDFDLFLVSIIAGLGASIGGGVGYYIGQIIGRPLLLRLGKYMFISEKDLEGAEKWIHRWGAPSTFILRSIQYMPYKTFNFAAGISKMDFKVYFVLTIIGTIIRCFSLVYIGRFTSFNISTMLLVMFVLTVTGILVTVFRHNRSENILLNNK
jgi:membrane protein DedA with SNARE-associated domain